MDGVFWNTVGSSRMQLSLEINVAMLVASKRENINCFVWKTLKS